MGAGFRAAAATVMRSAQKVGELAAAIEEDLRHLVRGERDVSSRHDLAAAGSARHR
jgi:hypothetical protein